MDMRNPANTSQRFEVQTLKAILGPTNTGKTHFAVERMLAHKSGMIGLPLRLLAREVYQRVSSRVGAQSVALVTGEERIVPARARYWVATVEAMPLYLPVDFVAIDEIQTASDLERGHVFTNRILNARGKYETLLLGAATMAPIIRALLPGIEIVERPRLSQLLYSGSKRITRQPARTAIIAFSAAQVYAIGELVRRQRGGAAVVMGALSPRTRNAQVALYQNGDVDFLVATDAIGMGLNLDVQHVAFSADSKFDGRQTRPLSAAEMGQIAGRAGRHTTNGTFGVTGQAAPLDEEMVLRLESHQFDSVRVLQWRNPKLDFSSPASLKKSIEAAPKNKKLTRIPATTDQNVLAALIKADIAGRASGPAEVRLLWDCCQIPDYRDISPAHHGAIVTRIFTDLQHRQRISKDWIEEQVRFCDNVSGDMDTLSNRIKQIRTWTFVANRKNWLDDPKYWREKTRDIEDRLSDALHEKLTQRFVDRRTSVLIRHLRDKQMTTPETNDKGEVFLEGHLIGSLKGFRFNLAPSGSDADTKGLRSAASAAIAPEIHHRAQRLIAAPNEQIILSSDGFLRWKGEIIAEIVAGDDLFAPNIVVLSDETLAGGELSQVQDRLALWLRHMINTQLEQILALREPDELSGSARGIAFRLAENFGILPRNQVAHEVKGLDQEVRAKMRRLGVRFGAYHIYLPQSLKPAPRELALILYALSNGGLRQPGVTDIPAIVLSGRTSFEIIPEVNQSLYEIAGFKVAGKRAVRVDILERLADIIRPLISFDPARSQGEPPQGAAQRNGFRVTVQMTSLLGCAGEDFSSILKSLGYRVERKQIEKPVSASKEQAATPGVEPEPVVEAGQDLVQDMDPVSDKDLADAAMLDGVEPPETNKGAKASGADEETVILARLDGNEDANENEAAQIAEPAPASAQKQNQAQTRAELENQPGAQPNQPGVQPNQPGAQPNEASGAPSQHPDLQEPDLKETQKQDGQETGKETDQKTDKETNEPLFDEVWFPADRRSSAPKQRRPGQNQANKQGRSGQKPEQKQQGKAKKPFQQNAPKRAKPPRYEKPIDPDSPFAALAVLKQKQTRK